MTSCRTACILGVYLAVALSTSPSAASGSEELPLSSAAITRVSALEFEPVSSMAPGYEDELWAATERLVRLTAGGIVTDESDLAGGPPLSIARGPDEEIWFADAGSGDIAHITTYRSVSETSLPVEDGRDARAYGVAGDDAQHIWFLARREVTQQESEDGVAVDDFLGRLAIGEPPQRFFNLSAGEEAASLVGGVEGDAWLIELRAAKMLQVTPAGKATEFSLPDGLVPLSLTADPDGGVWFTASPDEIGRVTADGAIQLTLLDELPPEYGQIQVGPEDDAWVGLNNGVLARVTPAGEVTRFTGADAGFAPIDGLAFDPEGGLWYAEGHPLFGGPPTNLTRLTVPLEPTFTEPPSITASGLVGSDAVLSSAGAWSHQESVASQWLSCDADGLSCIAIPGATGSTLPLTAGLVGRTVHALVTASGEGGTASAESNSSPVVYSVPPSPEPPTYTTSPRIASVVSWRFGWSRLTHLTRVRVLLLEGVPVGATIDVLCHGKGCPFSRRQLKRLSACRGHVCRGGAHGPTYDLGRLFRGSYLHAGSIVSIEVLRTGWIGKAFRFTARKTGPPKEDIGCLAIGSMRFSYRC